MLVTISEIKVPAFPGASGWGAESLGGRGGKVVHVTNTNAGGGGSLKEAAQDIAGPRIIVFDVGGIIDLSGDEIKVLNPYIYIAGQTAPGGGITITGGAFKFFTHNIVMRYLSFRGSTVGGTAGGIFLLVRPDAGGVHDIIVDHCSVQWSEDDMISANHNLGGVIAEKIYNFTLSNCLFGYPGAAHPTSVLFSNDDYGDFHHVSIHNNLWSTSGNRSPNVQGIAHAEVINNFIYNWRDRVGECSVSKSKDQGSEVDYIGNYWHRTAQSAENFVKWQDENGTPNPPSIYARGNMAPVAGGLVESPILNPDADNWVFFSDKGNPVNPAWERETQLSQPIYPVPEVQADVARTRILANVGNNAQLLADGTWVARRDSYDDTLLDEATNDTGGDPYNAPDIPINLFPVPNGTPYLDTDKDGMADEWELENGFDPGISDGAAIGPSGYSNVELFLNGPTGGPIMSVVDDLAVVEAALRAEAVAIVAQADAVAQAIVDLKAVDDVLDAAADVIEAD